jgi:hypothetical protein
MNSRTRPEPPPEAALIATALKRSGLSARKAAPLAGIGEARWRQITSGYQSVSGSRIPVRAPDDTLARMAAVVGVTPEELRQNGRPEAAEELERLKATPPPRATGQFSPPLDAVTALLAALTPEEQEEVIRRLRERTPTPGERGDQHRQAG